VQAVWTNGYVCETLSALASLSGSYLNFSSAAMDSGLEIIDLLTLPTLDGGSVPVSCATNAVTVLANLLHAIALNMSVAEHKTQVHLVQSIESGLGNFVLRLLSETAVGEHQTLTAGAISAISVSRTSLGPLLYQPTSLLLLIPWDAAAAALEFRLPAGFWSEALGANVPVVDLEISLHGIAPATGNRTIVSGLCCLSVALPDHGAQAIQGLILPVLITIPLTVPIASSVLESQFECVFWDRGGYNSQGCWLEEEVIQNSTVIAVICACTHLNMFAVSFSSDSLGVGYVPVTSLSTEQKGNVTEQNANLFSTPVQSTSSGDGTMLVSFITTGAFGVITSFASLLQQASALKGVLTQSITGTLAAATGHGKSLTVIIILVCLDGQCLSFSHKYDTTPSSTGLQQMRVDFQIQCDTMETLLLVSSSVVTDFFFLQLAQHIESNAASENLGNWSVVASGPKVSHQNPISNTELHHHSNIVYNTTSADGGVGTGVKDGVSSSNSNLQLSTEVIVGICAGISTTVCCISLYIWKLLSRKKLKLAPTEVIAVSTSCSIHSQLVLLVKNSELQEPLSSLSTELNQYSEENVDDSEDVTGGPFAQDIDKAAEDSLEAPIIPNKNPCATASTQDSNTCVHVDPLVQGRLMPSSITFLKSLPNMGEFEQQGSAAPSTVQAASGSLL
jgi:hypothetical protein